MTLIVSQGSGATISTDIIDGEHFSYGKIVSSATGSRDGLKVTNGNLGSLVTVLNPVSIAGNLTITGPISLSGNVTLSDSKGFVGLVSVAGFSTPLPVSPLGNVTLSDPKTFIGSVSVGGIVDSKGYLGLVTTTPASAWPDPKSFVGLVSIGGGSINLGNSATVTPGRFVGQAIGMPAGGTFTITLASLASGFARSSTLLSNISGYPAALISLKVTAGGIAPTHGGLVGVYLLRGDGTVYDDNVGSTDSNASILNAPLIGNIQMLSLVSSSYKLTMDTSQYGPLGTYWGIGIQNNSAWLSGTEGDHTKDFVYYIPENR